MKKICFIFIILLLFQSILNSASRLIEIENEFIKLTGVSENAGFFLRTTGGDPELDKDNDLDLLTEDYPPTSVTTVYINGKAYVFGDERSGDFLSKMMQRGDVIMAIWSAHNIDITQILQIVKGPTTGRMDTIEIQYNVVNKGARNNTVGIRIMLDPGIESYEEAFFKTPTIESITTETELSGDQMPDYWYTFDNSSEPRVKIQGSLKIPGFPEPNKIIFSSWVRFKKNLWDFVVKPDRLFKNTSGLITTGGRKFDSAVAIYWDAKDLVPDDGFTVKTYLGLYAPVQFKGEIFNITLANPDFTKGEPFKVTLDVQNISPFKAEKVSAEIILPDRLKLNFDEQNIKNLADIEINDNKTTSWSLLTTGTQASFINFKVKVSGTVNNKIETKIVENKIQFVKGEKAVVVSDTKYKYILYDFTQLNKIINGINNISGLNNELLDKINKLLADYKKAKYSEKTGKKDRDKIENRKRKIDEFEKKIPEAVKATTKHVEK